ncbi:type II toxin-antitoxin system VapC family toxin [Novosphingobium sp.]|uniref:type II toxin-antitoxin system VapC family toxin n=1 Tax=Novosphingobium sp. TaxID=1874826 RepID=UPI001EC52F3F|nr:type II toxin-antitoxin system VapC family toxin [Novosphingobium sp.]MBK6800818.1 type II toxin-antitoxin system VapC family toxin [Novosphingobium sp.]MBK9011376.1 type II toxin-antitoxin system VapC family toxin [Novosphingobium sp.]
MIRYLFDANVAVYAMDGGNPLLRQRMEDCEPGEIAISVISFAEVAYGTYVGKPPSAALLDAFLAAIPLIPFDEAAAHAYARLPFKRARFDRLLAAHALSIGATIITNNEADFADVPGLRVENWTL